MNVAENEIRSLLEKYQTIAVYGLSPDAAKPSHYVPVYMREHGWKIVGTYPDPKAHAPGPFKIHKSLRDVPANERRFLDVFRASNKIPDVVDEVLELGGVEVLWLQLGIAHPEAEARAAEAGLKVVSNRCLIVEHRRVFNS